MSDSSSTHFPDQLSAYGFELPEDLVAQEPSERREAARLLVVRREPSAGAPRFEDLLVSDLPQLAREEPALRDRLWVRNVTKVFPARFYARRPTGGRHEIVLTRESATLGIWEALVRGSSSFHYPQPLEVEGWPEAWFAATGPTTLDLRSLPRPLPEILEKVGEMPLPPYIRKREAARDRVRYQTVWARDEAQKSVAAPTASLHFTPELVGDLERSGVSFVDTVLHVGLGTFAPVRVERISQHRLHEEEIEVGAAPLSILREAAARHDLPFIAIGTTALRNIESLSLRGEPPRSEADYAEYPEGGPLELVRAEATATGGLRGSTKLFVRPGFRFRYTGALLTNFHLPESTLFVLVTTFAGSLALTRAAYEHAIQKRYRFFSYGDASLWL